MASLHPHYFLLISSTGQLGEHKDLATLGGFRDRSKTWVRFDQRGKLTNELGIRFGTGMLDGDF